MVEATTVGAVSRRPRAMAWVLLLATALAVLVTGLATTVIILARFRSLPLSACVAFDGGADRSQG